MYERFEGELKGHKNLELFYQGWEVKNPKGSVIIVHGQGEHSECYNPFATFLNENDWNSYALDLRGHGKSEGQRGYAKNFDDYEKDVIIFIDFIKKTHPQSGPFILFGHSMGGLICIKATIGYGSSHLSALALSAPGLGLNVEVPVIKDKIAHYAANLLPRITLGNEIKFTDLTSDVKVIESFNRDSLRHQRISPGVYLGMKAGFIQVTQFVDEIKLPVLMQLSGLDPVVSTPAAEKYFKSLNQTPKKQMYVYEKSLHEILNDKEREQVMKDFLSFINTLA